ncbi:MAG: DEAD/DEAH box helicase [Actinobacteria bacterium]|nr:DEAD/DEAH box helicase [Actinomycetota bacterium]
MTADPFTSFDLEPRIRANVARAGITQPTPIQAAAIPHLLQGRDLVGQARTGSGKTLAFVLPLLQRLDRMARGVQALILTPTRELAEQIARVIADTALDTGVRTALVYGGVGYGTQIRDLERGAQIVVGTPGRVLDLAGTGRLRVTGVRMLILDEADMMLDIGMAPQVEQIVATLPVERQTALFSATIPEWIDRLVRRHLRNPVRVEIDAGPEGLPDIDHEIWIVPSAVKAEAVARLIAEPAATSTIVFGRTRYGVEGLARKLTRLGHRVACLQGGMAQPARTRVLERFAAGDVGVLVATNVAARGLDISHVGLVVNHDVPDDADMFTHRTGRTGRMGRAGRSVTLVSAAELNNLRGIERMLKRKLPRRYWDEIAPDAPVGATGAALGLRSTAGEASGGREADAFVRTLPGESLSGRGPERSLPRRSGGGSRDARRARRPGPMPFSPQPA